MDKVEEAYSGEHLKQLNKYDVIWKSKSNGSKESMPIGNGDIGLNVWVQDEGDLYFDIGKTDAWSEVGRLLKIGRVRVGIHPNPFCGNVDFCQQLNLEQGAIKIVSETGDDQVVVKLWVDANGPRVFCDVTCTNPIDIEVEVISWRYEKVYMTENTKFGYRGVMNSNKPVFEEADKWCEKWSDRVIWYHRNAHSCYHDTLSAQKIEEFENEFPDPLMGLTFGASVIGNGLIRNGKSKLKSQKSNNNFLIKVIPLTDKTESEDIWLTSLDKLTQKAEDLNYDNLWNEHTEWWKKFWLKSWIYVDGDYDAFKVTQGYILQRFMNACAGRGKYPIKFNGSIFTMDYSGFNPDYRLWGGCYWFQNTRHIYWNMLHSGDFDLMIPFFNMYKDALALCKKITEKYYGHGGVFFPETMYFWGTYCNSDFGLKNDDVEPENEYIRYYWQSGIELCLMMLEYYSFTEDMEFAQNMLFKISDEVLTFYKQHWKSVDEKIVFSPSHSLEMYWEDVENPLPEVAGLKFLLNGLLEIDDNVSGKVRIDFWEDILNSLPPISLSEDGQLILPAEKYNPEITHNFENPELYAVFPYRVYGVKKENLQVGINTFRKRAFKEKGCWRQDAIQAACLGLTYEAKDYMTAHFSSQDFPNVRFPGFWSPGYDWIPDQDNGGAAMMALQNMLIQCHEEKIILFPAWPKEWNVHSKLYAPENTCIEVIYNEGKLDYLNVSPEERSKDIVNMLWEN